MNFLMYFGTVPVFLFFYFFIIVYTITRFYIIKFNCNDNMTSDRVNIRYTYMYIISYTCICHQSCRLLCALLLLWVIHARVYHMLSATCIQLPAILLYSDVQKYSSEFRHCRILLFLLFILLSLKYLRIDLNFFRFIRNKLKNVVHTG